MQASDILNDADLNDADATAAQAGRNVMSDDTTQVVGHEALAEIGGRDGLDPTRYGDWEKNGRCIDF